MKTGLILEGGAMRGLFTAGVIDVLMESGVKFDGLIGVSAGAAFGCNYKSNQPGRVIRYNKKYSKDPEYCSFRSLIKTGDLFGADFCYHKMPEKLDVFDVEAYNANPMDFYAVCTDVTNGEAIYHKCEKADYETLEWIRASASMPLASRVVEIGDKKLLDGGIADSIPLGYFESIGYDRNVVILTQPLDFVKKKNLLTPVMRLLIKDYPAVARVLAQRHISYNEETRYIREKEQRGEIIVIRPPEPLKIGRVEHNPEVMQGVYDIGRKSGEEKLKEIEEFLKIKY